MHRLNGIGPEMQRDAGGQVREVKGVGAFVQILRHLIGFGDGRRTKQVRVIVGAAKQQVAALGTVERIGSGTADQSIVQTVSDQVVCPGTTCRIFKSNRRIELQRTIRMHRLNGIGPKMQPYV